MTRTFLSAIALAAFAATAPTTAANLDAGKQKAQEVCQACHGMDGLSAVSAEYPKIGGQHQDYLAKVKALKPGQRARITILRDGQRRELSLTVGERPRLPADLSD